MTQLPNLMNIASREMQTELEKIRAAIQHNLSIGQALEESVRKFLRKHLPASIGVAQGQIIDAEGNVSRQMDAILYDTAATPILFISEEESNRLVPVEGVIGVVEVKASLSAADLPAVIENMKSVKRLRKTAYHRQVHPEVITSTYRMYGQELDHFPVLYSLLVFEASTLDNLLPAFKSANDVLPLTERIDHACLLNRGVIANGTPTGQLDTIPNPDTASVSWPTDHALLLWYLLIQRFYSQAKSEPINMLAYLPPAFTF